jgi:hypothetical protein
VLEVQEPGQGPLQSRFSHFSTSRHRDDRLRDREITALKFDVKASGDLRNLGHRYSDNLV